MPISLVGSHDQFMSNVDPWPHTTGIAVLPGDLILVASNIRNTGDGSLWVSFGTATGTTASISAYTNLFDSGAVEGFEPNLTCSWARVTGAGDYFGQADVNGERNGILVASAFRGVDTGTPFVSSNVQRGESSTPSATAITPTAVGQWLVALSGVYGGDWQTVTGTSGFTTIELSTNTAPARTLMEYKVAADTTTPLSGAPTLWGSTDWAASNILLNPAAEIIPGTTVSRGLLF